MNRYRGGPSKATPQTLCQKCLKRGHYSYECQAAARPYVSRPSRTQQLANPTLRPKLSSDVPNDLLRKTGVADEQLEKIEHDRKRRKSVDNEDSGTTKRSRSFASHSSSSVSTISTNLSRSSSPRQTMSYKTSQVDATADRSRKDGTRRSRDSSMSYSSDTSHRRHRRGRSRHENQDLARKLGNVGGERGRKSDGKRPADAVTSKRKRRRSRSSSMSYTSDSSGGRRGSKLVDNGRRTRPRRSTISPDARGRDRWSRAPRSSRRTPSRSNSMDRSQIARQRRSLTPDHASGGNGNVNEPTRANRDGRAVPNHRSGSDNDRYGSSFKPKEYEDRRPEKPRPAPPPRKERSLSPFSKRVALTQAMNMGR